MIELLDDLNVGTFSYPNRASSAGQGVSTVAIHSKIEQAMVIIYIMNLYD